MTKTLKIDSYQTPLPWVQIGFYVTVIVFNFCLIAQVLTVGVAYFHDPAWWQIHVWFVRGYSGLSLVILGWLFIPTFPRKIRYLAIGLVILLGLQFASIELKTPLHLEIFLPLIGFTLFYVSSSLVHTTARTFSIMKPTTNY